jgi:hypothetical protein
MEESARERKRNSARKKSEFSVYSQKAVRATELRWAKEKCLEQPKKSGDKKNHIKTKNGS